MLLQKENIFLGLEYSDSSELLKFLGTQLINQGNAKDTFVDALLKREQVTPTGIQTKSISVAIPHTDAGHVNKPAVVVATLKEPVKFCLMEDPEQNTDVSLVFMLAVNNPDEQIELLMKMSSILSDGELLVKISKCTSKEEILEYMKIINS